MMDFFLGQFGFGFLCEELEAILEEKPVFRMAGDAGHAFFYGNGRFRAGLFLWFFFFSHSEKTFAAWFCESQRMGRTDCAILKIHFSSFNA